MQVKGSAELVREFTSKGENTGGWVRLTVNAMTSGDVLLTMEESDNFDPRNIVLSADDWKQLVADIGTVQYIARSANTPAQEEHAFVTLEPEPDDELEPSPWKRP